MGTLVEASNRSDLVSTAPIGGRIPTLDGWRGVAILFVLADHLQHSLGRTLLPTGAHGVAIFFVLSGILITSKLRDEFERTRALNFSQFYTRRFFRLMPAAWLYLFAMWLVARSAPVALTRENLFACIFFFRNFVNTGSASFLTGHFWSLSIEEQYYIFWPAVLLLLGLSRARYFAIGAAILVALLRFQHWHELMNLTVAATFGTQFRADSLFIGCAAALSLPSFARSLRRWMIGPLLAALIACLFRFSSLIPLTESLIIGILLMATSHFSNSRVGRMLDSKVLVYLGSISYSLYLWQQPFLCTPMHGWLAALTRAAGVFLFALTSHYWIEKPMIQLGRRFS